MKHDVNVEVFRTSKILLQLEIHNKQVCIFNYNFTSVLQKDQITYNTETGSLTSLRLELVQDQLFSVQEFVLDTRYSHFIKSNLYNGTV